MQKDIVIAFRVSALTLMCIDKQHWQTKMFLLRPDIKYLLKIKLKAKQKNK